MLIAVPGASAKSWLESGAAGTGIRTNGHLVSGNSTCCTTMVVPFIYFYVLERYSNREGERERFSIHCLLFKCSQWLGLSQAEARSQEHQPSLPWVWQGPKSLSRHLLSQTEHNTRNVEYRIEAELYPRPSNVGCSRPKQHLNSLHGCAQ